MKIQEYPAHILPLYAKFVHERYTVFQQQAYIPKKPKIF
jgi:hypothetical protein